MANNENLIPIPGRLHSVATEGHVSGADEIYDDTQQKDQETINSELIAAVGTGGSVDSRIAAAINALDSTKSQSAGSDGLALSVTEEDGKITSISGSIAANTYDANGAAATAKTEVIGGATSSGNTLKKLEDRVSPLETAVGSGGSIDTRISNAVAAAKSELKGNASSACDTLGEAEDLIAAEATRAGAAEVALDTAKADKATTLADYGITDAYNKSETYSKTEINDHIDTPNQGYITAAADSNTTTANLKTLIDTAAGSDKEKADFIYRVGSWDGSQYDETVYSEYAWNGTEYLFLSKKSQVDEVFDISAYHANTPYADLTAALGTNGANVPQALRKGGMSIKFIQGSVGSSDNKYVQYRLMSDTFNTTSANWQGVDDEPTVGSDNLVKSEGVYGNSAKLVSDLLPIIELPTLKGWIDSSNKIINHGQSEFCVIKVKGGDIVNKPAAPDSQAMIVKSFDFNYNLPYTPDYATGETGRRNVLSNLTLPEDAKYILLSFKNQLGDNVLPSSFTINGIDIININWRESYKNNKDLIDNLSNTVETQRISYNISSSIIDLIPSVKGHLDGSNKIIAWGKSEHKAIKINGGEKIQAIGSREFALAFVKTFDIFATNNYPLDLATGETGVRNNISYKQTFIAPEDAKYLIIRSKHVDGSSNGPVFLSIDGVSYIDSLEKNLTSLEPLKDSTYQGNKTIIKQWINYFNSTETVYGVTVTCSSDGKFSFVGTANSSGGRGTRLTPLFYLEAGTYTLHISQNIPSTLIGYITPNSNTGEIPFYFNDGNTINISEPKEYYFSVNVINGEVYNYNNITIELKKEYSEEVNVTAYDAVCRNALDNHNLLQQFVQKYDIKINNIYTNVPGYQGMCTIDGILCSCSEHGIHVKNEQDTLIGTKHKAFGINTHNNDIDYCDYTNTLITATIPAAGDSEHSQLCLLQNAKEKLYSNTALSENDWLRITLPQELDTDYSVVSNCFGESCDIVYCLLIDKVVNYTNTNKRFLKLKLGLNNDGTYDGTYTILRNESWPYKIEIQGSKYCNGKLYVSTDDSIGTNTLHSSVTIIDVETLQTIEHISYRNQSEINDSIEAEGLSFLNDKLYQIVIISPNGDHTARIRQLREFDRFNL